MAKKKIKNLTLLNNSSSRKVDKYIISGLEEVVTQIREIDEKMRELQKQKTLMKEMILTKVISVKEKLEKNGQLFKSFVIESTDGNPATILFKNAFSKIDIENEGPMRKQLGDAIFNALYEVTSTISLKRNPDYNKLQILLGQEFDNFFKKISYINHRKEFMETRTKLRSSLTKKKNAALNQYITTCQATPDLRMK